MYSPVLILHAVYNVFINVLSKCISNWFPYEWYLKISVRYWDIIYLMQTRSSLNKKKRNLTLKCNFFQMVTGVDFFNQIPETWWHIEILVMCNNSELIIYLIQTPGFSGDFKGNLKLKCTLSSYMWHLKLVLVRPIY